MKENLKPSVTRKKKKLHGDNRKKKEPSKSKQKGNKQHFFYKKMLLMIWNILFYVSMLSILVGAGLMAVMQQENRSLNGYRMFGVLTDSMVSPDNTIKKGGFRSGDIILTKEVDPETIQVGDVITYRPSTNPTNESTNNLTHRVVKINDHLGNEDGLFFVTRGDANKTDDMPISATALVGKEVAVIPKIGGILSFVKDNWLLSLVFITSLLGFIWVMRTYILPTPPPEKNRKKKKRKHLSQKKMRQSTHGIPSKEDNIKKTKHNRRKHT